MPVRRSLRWRRNMARSKAPMWFALGCVVQGAAAALAVLIVLLGLARGYSFFTRRAIDEAPVWAWTAGAVTWLTAAIMVLTVGLAFLHGAIGVGRRVLRKLRATPVVRGTSLESDRLLNVVEALCIGSGWKIPNLAISADEAPNALSIRDFFSETLVVTSGLLDTLSRDELEAVCAHELSHLHAADARWVDAATYSMSRIKVVSAALMTAGGLLAYLGFHFELIVTTVIGVLLAAVGGVCLWLVSKVVPRLRAEADALADVAAITLSRNPESLGKACAKLAADTRRVQLNPRLVEQAWFKAPGEDPRKHLAPHQRRQMIRDYQTEAADELGRRAEQAYLEAGLPVPEGNARGRRHPAHGRGS